MLWPWVALAVTVAGTENCRPSTWASMPFTGSMGRLVVLPSEMRISWALLLPSNKIL